MTTGTMGGWACSASWASPAYFAFAGTTAGPTMWSGGRLDKSGLAHGAESRAAFPANGSRNTEQHQRVCVSGAAYLFLRLLADLHHEFYVSGGITGVNPDFRCLRAG